MLYIKPKNNKSTKSSGLWDSEGYLVYEYLEVLQYEVLQNDNCNDDRYFTLVRYGIIVYLFFLTV